MSVPLDVFIISMPESSYRRLKCKEQMVDVGIEFKFIDAVDGRKGLHPLLDKVNQIEFKKQIGREALPAEIGCYTSHFLCWKKCIDLNKPIIILEDDFALSGDFLKVVNTAAGWIDEYGFIRVENSRKKRPTKLIQENNGVRLFRFLKGTFGTTGYMISPAVAEKLISKSSTFNVPVDSFIKHHHLHGVPIYGVDPSAVFEMQPEDGFDSTIGLRKFKTDRLAVRLRLLYSKHKRRLMNRVYNIYFSLRGV